jgi:hypothetical protein
MAVKFPKEVILEYIKTYITEDIDDKYDPWININSVFTSDNHKKLGFNPLENRVFDFKLGQGWSIPGFIKQYDSTMKTESEATGLLLRIFMKLKSAGLIGKLDVFDNKPRIIQPIDLPNLSNITPMNNLLDEKVLRNSIGRKAVMLLMEKNITPKHIKKYKLKYVDDPMCWHCYGEGKVDGEECPVCDHGNGKNPYYGFIIIPTYEKGNLVYFQARNTDRKSNFRYRNPRLPRTQVVGFYDLLEEGDRIFITEGPFDAMTLTNYSATYLMGNRLSDPQILKILAKKPREIIFVPDYDKEEETRNNIFRALKKNIDRIKFHRVDKDIKIGVYHWYDKYKHKLVNGKKDINDINLNVIEDDLIQYEL